ncbi:tubulin delta chain-like isoform X2 [Watersipora subatra]|uniref:tubulin delta chain-like isoform X2 n=1 Tax=Watersipora subatra TaxID=2589382 RepID=UPI00355C803F
MATVPVYVGQCGNQLGFKLDEAKLKASFSNDPSSGQQEAASLSSWTPEKKSYRRCIMIDTETKVVNKLNTLKCKLSPDRKKSKELLTQTTREENIIFGKRGRGNNWALGYEGLSTERILEQAIESIRKESERCDMFNNIMMVQSLCGGTGGGLGSRLLETLRNEFRLEHIISCVVAPFTSGDTPLQHYNALLSLTSLQKFSDAVLLFRNDMVSRHCSEGQQAAVSFAQMNLYMAKCIAGLTLPTDTLTPVRGYGCELELSEIVRSVCPQPSLKFLTTNHKSRQTTDVKALCNAVVNLTKQESMGKFCQCLSSVAVIRGPETERNAHTLLPAMEKRIRKELSAVSWNPFPIDYWLASQSKLGARDEHDVTLVSNYSNIIPYAEHVWSRAQQMYRQKAYLHWYYKHGLSQEYFEEAFYTVEEIVDNYTEAVR